MLTKTLLISLLVLNTLTNCTQSQENQATMIENITPTQQVSKSKQYIYGLDLTMQRPYELYFDDILVDRDLTGANVFVDLRQWLLKNGTYQVKIKVFPYEGELLKFDDATGYLNYARFLEDDNGNVDKNTTVSQPLKFNFPQEPVPYFEQEWTINVDSLPYQLEGWSNGEDLSKYKEEKLEKEVVRLYEKFRKSLDDGHAEEWLKMTEQRQKETNTFSYSYDERKIREKFEKNSRKIREKAKGNMIPLKNYRLAIYGEKNQLVRLETKDSTQHLFGVLETLEPDGAARVYNVLLYRPKGTKDFVIIRK